MGYKYNPLIFNGLDLTGSGSITSWKSPIATEVALPTVGNIDGDARVTLDSDYIWLWDGTTSRWINSGIKVSVVGSTPNANGYSLEYVNVGANRTELRLILQPADATNPGVVTTGTQTFAGDKTFNDDVVVQGDFTVNGTTTTINTVNLTVEDQNITINFGGNDASAEGAGLTVDRTGVDGSLVYEDALASKWKAGALGSEIQLVNISSSQILTNKDLTDPSNTLTTASSSSFTRPGNAQLITIPDSTIADNFVLAAFTQTLTNKSIDSDTNTITNIENADIKTLAGIDATKIHDGSVDNTEFGYLNGVTSPIQTQIDAKVTGPASATDNAIVRFDSTTGKLVQNSLAILNDLGALSGLTQLDIDNIRVDSNTISSTDVNGNINISPNGTGDTLINSDVSITGSTTLNTGLTGPLKATAGVVSTSNIDLTSEVTGTLPIANGGTNSNAALSNNRLIRSSAGAIVEAVALTNGQLFIGSTGAFPSAASLTPGAGISIVSGAGSISIAQSIPPSNGDIAETSFSLTNSQTNANITGLAFANGVVRSAKIQYSVVINDATDYYEEGQLSLVQRGADWTISRTFSGDDSLLDFDINTSGQVLYTSPAYSTFVSGLMKFRAEVTTV